MSERPISVPEAIWANVEAALTWIDTFGDPDRDGFLEYVRKSPTGLDNQGWKDSHDSISHEDGSMAEGPIALCEVQGYAYDAKLRRPGWRTPGICGAGHAASTASWVA